jgi:hypothetical protein
MQPDIRVRDAGWAEQELLALGATLIRVQAKRASGSSPTLLVTPFCTVFRRHGT